MDSSLASMGSDLHTLVFHVIIVICLILISYSQLKIAHSSVSGFVGGDRLAYAIEPSGSNGPGSQSNFVGGPEAPVFWNMGSASETAKALAQAAAQTAAEATSDFSGSKVHHGGARSYKPFPPVSVGAPYGM